LNLVKRHTKPNPQANQPGGIVEREASVHISNVQLVNPATGQGRAHRLQGACRTAAKVRTFRSSGEVADA
jgi:large subunit ribosomal protein L24